ncbi:MAG: hypothetical protein NUV77_20605 [Thermoguttaceae bacterium]|jgi:hypothetical protein|nr:hypothetical protein [Thermoguttaceae bacterium]
MLGRFLPGPRQHSPRTEKFEARPVVQLKAMQGWERVRTTGQLVNLADRDAKSIERALPFSLDQAPAVSRARRAEEGPR